MAGEHKPFRITNGRAFQLRRVDPDDTGDILSEDEAADRLAHDLASIRNEQEKLYAQRTWSLLLVFQAMDAAGKDSAIEHVMSGLNPQGCQVFSFGVPSAEELAHDFLWRAAVRLPERGRIGVFNRSYYEEVLVVRVHPELLAKQGLPPEHVSGKIWQQRFEDINAFERHLHRSGVMILKFFLHVSKKTQRERFLDRIDTPSKNWKFSAGDVRERGCWRQYMAAFEDMIRNTATPHAPWYVVPADHKWFTRLVVGAAVADTLKDLDPHFPTLSPVKRTELEASRRTLRRERG